MSSDAIILKALATVREPDGSRDIVAAGRVADIARAEGRTRVTLKVPVESASLYAPVADAARAALADAGVEAQVLLTAHRAAPQVNAPKPAPGPARRGQPHKPKRPDGRQGDALVRNILVVSSAKGGVGKSTVAINLAWALARTGLRTGVLDADVHGPSLPLLSGLKGARAETVEVEGRTLIRPLEAHGAKLLSIGFLTRDDGPIVWRGPMVQGAISRMLWDADWGELDLLVIDMPPGTGDPQLGLAQDILPSFPGMAALVVTTPQDLALEDARKGRKMFAKVGIDVIGTVLNMSAFTCPHCGEDTPVFGEADMESLADIPLTLELRRASEAGRPGAEAAFDALADSVVAAMAGRAARTDPA